MRLLEGRTDRGRWERGRLDERDVIGVTRRILLLDCYQNGMNYGKIPKDNERNLLQLGINQTRRGLLGWGEVGTMFYGQKEESDDRSSRKLSDTKKGTVLEVLRPDL